MLPSQTANGADAWREETSKFLRQLFLKAKTEKTEMSTQHWLEQTQSGYSLLSHEEKSSMADFMIVWSVFEAHALDKGANAASIVRLIDNYPTTFSSVKIFAPCLAYFRNRYVIDGKTNQRFEHLCFRQNDRRDMVENVLIGVESGTLEVAKALLLIVFRLRNNLFHGLKWVDQMRDQKENFDCASKIIMAVYFEPHYTVLNRSSEI